MRAEFILMLGAFGMYWFKCIDMTVFLIVMIALTMCVMYSSNYTYNNYEGMQGVIQGNASEGLSRDRAIGNVMQKRRIKVQKSAHVDCQRKVHTLEKKLKWYRTNYNKLKNKYLKIRNKH